MRVLRPVTPEELPGFLAQASAAFQSVPLGHEEARGRANAVDADRTLGAFEDGELVGTARTEAMPLSVPGGRVRACGIGGVSVLPTHRRRGIMTGMMRRLIGDARKREEPVAILFASEGAIYGRYGFGVASYESQVRVARRRGAFRAATDVARLRLAEFADAVPAMVEIVDRATRSQPGAVRRSDAWWGWAAGSPPPGSVPLEVVLRSEGDGFAAYERRIDFSLPTLDGGTLVVQWLFADSAEAYAALWRYCLDVDLMEEVRAPSRPVDEPLRHLLADPRALESRVWDGLWLQLVDVEAALAARTYTAGAGVRIGLEDAFCPWNTGTYEVGGEGCRRVEAAPDLLLASDALGACYLGGNRFTTLAWAGRVEERSPGAAARADMLFAAPRAPWCPFHF